MSRTHPPLPRSCSQTLNRMRAAMVPRASCFATASTGSPKSMIGWAKHLEAAGLRVLLPRLPGHGTSWQELNETAWMDWYGCVDDAFAALGAKCDQVFIAGLSMGGGLALRLAERHGHLVSGLVLVNPVINISDPRMRVLPILRLAVPSFVRHRQ